MMTKSEVEEMLKEINASKEAEWQEMAKNPEKASKSVMGAVYSELKEAQGHGVIKAFIASSLQDGSTHVALSGDMTELLVILADVIVDVCEEPDSPDKIERFCESLKEAAVVELAKRKALH